MKAKTTFYTECAYALGVLLLALGTAMMERAGLGMSMVVAPAYVLHLKVSQYLPFFSFGMAEYVFQALLLAALALALRRMKISYLCSFATAVLYGLALDLCMRWISPLPAGTLAWRLPLYLAGMGLCALGVALLFHTYITPEAYELVVKEVAETFHCRLDRVKTLYDIASCLLAVLMSFLFFGFGRFVGVRLGTVLCALVNGWLIGRISRALESVFQFRDALPLRDFFSR